MSTILRFRLCCMCAAALLVGVALALTASIALADESVDEGSTAYADAPALGHITLLLTGKANGSGVTMAGGELSLYRVASIDRTNPSQHSYDVSAGQFGSSGAVSGIPSMTKQQLDAQNPTISESLEQEVAKNKVEPLQTVPIASGEATFPQVEEGLYLIMQTKPSDHDRTVRAFIISVPNEAGELGVVATPKPGAWDGFDPNNPNEPNEPKEQEKAKDTKKDEDKKSGSTTTSATGLKVPAAGDGSSPIALVASTGLALVVAGRLARGRVHAHA